MTPFLERTKLNWLLTNTHACQIWSPEVLACGGSEQTLDRLYSSILLIVSLKYILVSHYFRGFQSILYVSDTKYLWIFLLTLVYKGLTSVILSPKLSLTGTLSNTTSTDLTVWRLDISDNITKVITNWYSIKHNFW